MLRFIMLIRLPVLSVALSPIFPRQDGPFNSSTPLSTIVFSDLPEPSDIASSVLQVTSEVAPSEIPSDGPTLEVPSGPLQTSDQPLPSATDAVTIAPTEQSAPASSPTPRPTPTTLVTVEQPSFVEPSAVPTPTILPCADQSWNPSPDTWESENVDQKLRDAQDNWAGDMSFVDYIASLTGQHSQRCGVGQIGTCTVPDCNALQASGGPKWAYFVSVSIVQMNTFINVIHNGIDSGKSDLGLIIGQMTNDFFHWEPKPTKASPLPWIGAVVSTVLAFLPLPFGPAFMAIGTAFGASAAAFINGGLATIAPSADDPHTFYLGTMQELGVTLKDLSFNTTEALDQWSQTLFSGKPDASGKSIIDYFGGGRFTLNYDLSVSAMQKFYFQTMVSSVVNEQWKSPNASTRQFVMCANGTAPCDNRSVFVEGGRTCCLYSLTHDGKYINPAGLDALDNSTFDISASKITAGSLHSFLAQGFNYTLDDDHRDTRIEASLGTNSTTQAFDQGVAFQGTWTLPVCDVGSNTNWVGNYDTAGFPCCCGAKSGDGATCTQTNDFINTANMAEWGKFYDDCKAQYPGFEGPAGKKNAGCKSHGWRWWTILLVVSAAYILS